MGSNGTLFLCDSAFGRRDAWLLDSRLFSSSPLLICVEPGQEEEHAGTNKPPEGTSGTSQEEPRGMSLARWRIANDARAGSFRIC